MMRRPRANGASRDLESARIETGWLIDTNIPDEAFLPLEPARIRAAKAAYTTRFIEAAIEANPRRWHLLSGRQVVPRSGDVVLARVHVLGQHLKLESPVSRRQTMFPGDEILVAYGNRYAPDQFEAEVPADLGPINLVAAGGVAARVTEQHLRMEEPTIIAPVGLLADANGVVNLADHAPYCVERATHAREPLGGSRPTVIAVIGTSMNSGKTTTLACLARGLVTAGYRVHTGKATGTGAGGDPRLFMDAGAQRVLDFTDFGLPSTYRLDHDRVVDLFASLLDALADPDPTGAAPDCVLIEIADGVYQDETARLLMDPVFQSRVDRVVFASGEALGAAAGVGVLEGLGLTVAAVSGVVTSSPLAAREAASVVTPPVVETYDLTDAATALSVARPLVRAPAAMATAEVRVPA
jgi:hypothetical protein